MQVPSFHVRPGMSRHVLNESSFRVSTYEYGSVRGMKLAWMD